MGNVLNILQRLQNVNMQMDIGSILVCIVMSFLFSILITLMYRFFFKSRNTPSGVEHSFLMIGPAVTAIFLAIQFSLPLSLGLLGALSFVRFRTPIKQPEEVGYILLLIASSIGCATFNFKLVGILLVVILIALFFKRFIPQIFFRIHQRGVLLISLKEKVYQEAEEGINSFIKANFTKAILENVSLTEGIARLFYHFEYKDRENIGNIINKLNGIAPIEKVNIFLEGLR